MRVSACRGGCVSASVCFYEAVGVSMSLRLYALMFVLWPSWLEDRCGCLAFQELMSKTFSCVAYVCAVRRRSCRVMNK